MESGFGENLEGFLIKGNLSLIQSDIPSLYGDGSIEGSGTLYINNINEYNVSSGVILQNVFFQNDKVTVPHTQDSSSLTSASFLLNGGMSIQSTSASSSLTSGGALTIAGGASIAKNTNIGGILDVSNNRISSVSWPTLGTDAANKDYVDSITFGSFIGNFTAGQVLVGDTGGNVIGFPGFTFDGNQLSINYTKTASNLSSASFVTLGGASFGDNVIINNTLNMSGTSITNVPTPINGTDAVNKDYVDSITGVNGNFTNGQLIVADSSGNSIRGYDNITFNTTTSSLILSNTTSLALNNTTNSLGLSSGGTLNINGGASILKDVYIGGTLDVNMNNITSVSDPIDDYDAVNKRYIDDFFGDDYILLNTNQILPIDIPDFVISSDIRAFITYIYVQSDQDLCSIFTIRGINRGSSWYIQKTFVGDITNIDFFIRYDIGNGILQYTNTNTTGNSSIRYITLTQIEDVDNSQDQHNINLNNNVVSFTDITELSFLNTEYDAVKIVIYLSDDSNNKYGMVFLNCLLKGTTWFMLPYSFGNVTGISFSISTTIDSGVIQYINTNSIGSYTIRASVIPILKTQTLLTLQANTLNYTSIHPTFFNFYNSQLFFHLTVYVTVPTINKYALFELEGFIHDNIWSLNSRFVGDLTNVRFSLASLSQGILQFTNTNIHDAYIRYALNTPLSFDPLPVKKGGSGNSYLTSHAVLRGNGIDPILATNDFIYKDYQLQLGTSSSIILTSTSNSTLVSYGGASFSGNLSVGPDLSVNNILITPSVGDLVKEQSFNATHNISNANIVGLYFSDSIIKSFVGTLCVSVFTLSTEFDALYDIKALRKTNGWILNMTYIGEPLGLTFTITPSGQMRYSSPFFPNWVNTLMKFRGTSTTI